MQVQRLRGVTLLQFGCYLSADPVWHRVNMILDSAFVLPGAGLALSQAGMIARAALCRP
jgi:hypothetical protein